MRYSVLGFHQENLMIKFGNKIDLTDLYLLDYIWQAQAQQSMQHIFRDQVAYVWLQHSKVIEDLPILNIKEDMLGRRLKLLVEFGLLDSKRIANDKNRGTKIYYAITPECESLRYSVDDLGSSGKNSEWSMRPSGKNSESDNKLKIDNKLEKRLKKKEIIVKEETKAKTQGLATAEDIKTVVDLYHSICITLPKVRAITDKRKEAIKKILNKYSLEEIKEAFTKCEESDFAHGQNDRGWKADLDFILREDKFVNILEGKYGGKRRSTNVSAEGHLELNRNADKNKMKEAMRRGEATKF